ncbi:MAG: CRTAC1 family protein [Planctomycetes bacterium]|nr:CRTAC1 family protein [Planctomycetota bacterium]
MAPASRPLTPLAALAALAGVLLIPSLYFVDLISPEKQPTPKPIAAPASKSTVEEIGSTQTAGNGTHGSSPDRQPEEDLQTVMDAEIESAGGPVPDPTAAPGTRRMAERLARIAREANPLTNLYDNRRRAAVYRQQLDAILRKSHPDPLSEVSARYDLAEELLRAGEIEEALTEFQEVFRQVQAGASDHPWLKNPSFQAKLHARLAVCHLRFGEQSNCFQRHGQESCIFPIQGSGVHVDTRGSGQAIQEYLAALEIEPDNLAHRWLLNLAFMTLGEYPDRVPPRWLIPPSAFESPYDAGRFADVAPAAGVSAPGRSGSCAMEDFDGDGRLDLIVSSSGLLDQLRYFHNEGDGTFTDRTREAGLTGITGGLNLCHADYNNDGFPDVLLLRGAWVTDPGRDPNSLLRNNGGGTFEDVTEQAGLLSFHPTLSAAWADVDNDGWLDLFVGNELGRWGQNPMEFFHNNRDGTFTECARAMGLAIEGNLKGCAWGDYNNDGLPDLYLSFIEKPNRLFRNERTRFADVTEEAGVPGPNGSFPTWFCDYDNDGWLDLFAAGFPQISSQGELGEKMLNIVAAWYLQRQDVLQSVPLERSNKLYRNRHDGSFEDVTVTARLNVPVMPMGANFGDIDNDGFPDFYIGTGNADFSNLVPNRMFRNAEGRFFQDVTTSGGLGHLQKGHGIAFGDIDQDGDQDIYAVMGGAFEGDTFMRALFINPGHGNHWLTLRLEGVRSNRSALGVRIRVRVESPEGERDIHAVVSTGGSFGSSSLQQEIGLGQARRIRLLEVLWPTSGERQVFEDVAMDQCLSLREGDSSVRPVRFEPIPMPSGASPSQPCH